GAASTTSGPMPSPGITVTSVMGRQPNGRPERPVPSGGPGRPGAAQPVRPGQRLGHRAVELGRDLLLELERRERLHQDWILTQRDACLPCRLEDLLGD